MCFGRLCPIWLGPEDFYLLSCISTMGPIYSTYVICWCPQAYLSFCILLGLTAVPRSDEYNTLLLDEYICSTSSSWHHTTWSNSVDRYRPNSIVFHEMTIGLSFSPLTLSHSMLQPEQLAEHLIFPQSVLHLPFCCLVTASA